VTDINGTTAPESEDFFDDAEETFPGKEDLKDRLVAVFALENGQDKNPDGKLYPFTKTVTVVLDNGPDGKSHLSAVRDGEVGENRVGEAPTELDLRWSTSGMVSRLAPRVGKGFRPLLGRINSQPNKVKSRSASWSISSPTDEDKALVRAQHLGLLHEVAKRLERESQAATDTAAFDE